MWMMGYNDSGEFNMPDSFNGRKLRPLMPRPMSSTDNNPASSPSSSPGLGGRLHGTEHIFALNHHLATTTDGKKEFNPQPAVVVSSRWNPTPEQLRTLEELYRRGTRTPTADQIQHITAQLRRYGKIEGKNVFYWFQNHKARERQKRRRQMESAPEEQYRGGGDVEIFERKDSGASRTGYEGEETKNYWAPSNNCSALSEESASIQRTAKAGVADCRPDGWIQFDEGELLQHRKSFIERNATWQTMQQFPCPSPTHLINTITTTSTAAAATNIASIAAAAATAIGTRTATTQGATIRTMDPKLIKAPDFNIFVATHREIGNGLLHLNSSSVINEEDDDGCSGESPTLQLFPLHSSNGDGNEDFEDKEVEVSATSADLNANFTSCKFFEFLPLKN